uniref:Putative microplusin 4 n=1 Tax=Amblyomma cajennense TaxID=34607 RepID=A0A023FSQ6_AMBCJ
MNPKALVALMLVGLVGLASADHDEHHHHGSVCALEREAQVALVGCLQEHLDEGVRTKLNAMQERFECDQLHCVFQKMCERNQGTLEHSGNEFFTDAEKDAFRSTISTCRDAAHQAN